MVFFMVVCGGDGGFVVFCWIDIFDDIFYEFILYFVIYLFLIKQSLFTDLIIPIFHLHRYIFSPFLNLNNHFTQSLHLNYTIVHIKIHTGLIDGQGLLSIWYFLNDKYLVGFDVSIEVDFGTEGLELGELGEGVEWEIGDFVVGYWHGFRGLGGQLFLAVLYISNYIQRENWMFQ